MARKRSVFFHAVQSILNTPLSSPLRKGGQRGVFLAAIFLALLTLILSLSTPTSAKKVTGTESTLIAQSSKAFELEQQGKEYYDTGRFALSVRVWQQAADAYGQNEDGRRNLINKAKALQSLGLYPEACSQLLQSFAIFNLTCQQFINNPEHQVSFFKKIEESPNSINKIIGLRFLGETLQRLGKFTTVTKESQGQNEEESNCFATRVPDLEDVSHLNLPQKVLKISWQALERYPEEKSKTLLTLGNIEREQGHKNRELLEYNTIVNFITKKCNGTFLEIYDRAFSHYDKVAEIPNPITQIQAKLNQLSLLLDIQEWWNDKINKHKDLLNRQKDSLSRQKDLLAHQTLENSRLQQFDNIQNRLLIIPKQLNNIEEQRKSIEEKLNKMVNLPNIESLLSKLPKNRESVYAQINFTNSLMRLNNNQKEYFSPQKIAKLLFTAIQQARSLGDNQAEATALSHLARLYELQVAQTENLTQQNQFYLAQAKNLTEQALYLSHDINIDNRQVLYRHRHQLGRILKAQGNITGALASYAEAWNILESLRADLVSSADNQLSFRQDVEPVYREFIDLLLQAESTQVNLTDLSKLVLLNNIAGVDNLSEGETPTETPKNLLDIARLVMESLQLAELDNFFEEPCSPPVAKSVQIDKIDRDAAVIYPIILENRLEVILSRYGKPSLHYPTLVTQKKVKNTLEDLANIIYNQVVEPDSALQIKRTIRNNQTNVELEENQKKVWQLSQNVYDWLIKPLELDRQLDPKQIKTLVFVLDRPFQKIPIAALYDGKNYLIEKYNIALNLGQQLIEPKPLQPKNLKILAAGVSQERFERGQNFLALENVKAELESIKNLGISAKILLDREFDKITFQEKLKSFHDIVHLVTHGVFSSNREQTFILTGNSSIGIDDFQKLLNPQDRIRNRAIELLVLSACETAAGDERAALGIAGVVLRFGASSTVATLWSVSDDATAKLMEEFYKNLTNREQKMTRVEAFSNAQRLLLKDENYKQYRHPFYWAPFILVGNWL